MYNANPLMTITENVELLERRYEAQRERNRNLKQQNRHLKDQIESLKLHNTQLSNLVVKQIQTLRPLPPNVHPFVPGGVTVPYNPTLQNQAQVGADLYEGRNRD